MRPAHQRERRHTPVPVPSPFENDGLSWDQLDRFLTVMRDQKPDLSVGAVQVFLYIARQESENILELPYLHKISQELGATYSTTARHCDVLAEGVGGTGGLGWIEKVNPGAGIKVKFMRISAKGRNLLLDVVKADPAPDVPPEPEDDQELSPS
jgi:DNA-binding MarR family transcriptional regulator